MFVPFFNNSDGIPVRKAASFVYWVLINNYLRLVKGDQHVSVRESTYVLIYVKCVLLIDLLFLMAYVVPFRIHTRKDNKDFARAN